MIEAKKYLHKLYRTEVEVVQYQDGDFREIESWILNQGGLIRSTWSLGELHFFELETVDGWLPVDTRDYIIASFDPDRNKKVFHLESRAAFDSFYTEVPIEEDMPEALDLELVARVVHEANRAVQIYNAEEDLSPEWDEAPQWQKDSAFQGILEALEGATPEQLHISWVQYKLDSGWRYGPVKDENQKTHPCLVTYEELPDGQKLKDLVFSAVVKAFKDAYPKKD